MPGKMYNTSYLFINYNSVAFVCLLIEMYIMKHKETMLLKIFAIRNPFIFCAIIFFIPSMTSNLNYVDAFTTLQHLRAFYCNLHFSRFVLLHILVCLLPIKLFISLKKSVVERKPGNLYWWLCVFI